MTSATKICYQCGEEIKEIARKCPYCQSWQNRIGVALTTPSKASLLLALLPFIFVLMPIILTMSLFFPLRDRKMEFEKHQAEVSVSSSKMIVLKDSGINYISTVGMLKNYGNLKWGSLTLEVQYFNQAGNLIDTQSDKNYDIILLPHSEHAFRLRQVADKPESEYVTHKVFVRDAENAARWP